MLGAVLRDVSVQLEGLHSLHQGLHLPTAEQGNNVRPYRQQSTNKALDLNPDPTKKVKHAREKQVGKPDTAMRAFISQNTTILHSTQRTKTQHATHNPQHTTGITRSLQI